jgi:hypothetical protein
MWRNWKKVCEKVYQNHLVSFTNRMYTVKLTFNLTCTNMNIPSTNVSEEHNASIFRVEEFALLAPASTLVSCLAYSSTLKIEATCSSETSVHFQWTTWHYISEHRTLHNNCREPQILQKMEKLTKWLQLWGKILIVLNRIHYISPCNIWILVLKTETRRYL